MPDGSIVLLGGYDGSSNKNDVWRSTDNGATWTQVTASAAWSARNGHSSVVMPDGSIVLLGGQDSSNYKNDVWRSIDNGLSWTYVTANAGWSQRYVPRSVAMPDGSIVLMGGSLIGSVTNDVWRFVPTGSSAQHPSHTYTTAGSYKVALQAYDSRGFNSTRKTGYVTVTTAPVPGVNFQANVTAGALPLPVSFTDLSLNNPTGWAWFFGDETYTAPWTQICATAGWSKRYYQSSVAMPDGSIVLMGGYWGGSLNDVWRSTDNGVTWMQQTAHAWSTARNGHSSVVMPDGSIVLLGGYDGSYKNDTWRSIDLGVTWTRVNASAGWSARNVHSSVAMPDGSIVLLGGHGSNYENDTWRSTDNGATWTQVNASSGWSPRYGHTSVVMPDGSIVLLGGYDGSSNKNDVWRSTDNGATWTQVTASAAWSARNGHSGVVMPDGSIVLLGGQDSNRYKNDMWRSTDNGLSWTYVNASAAWSERYGHSSVAMRDGSIVLMGGSLIGSGMNDVWRFVPTGSSAQHPSHTYTTAGSYKVALEAYDSRGFNSSWKTGYITVTELSAPVANFTANVTSGAPPLPVSFTDLSSNNPTGWAWYFGDENLSARWMQVNASAGWSARRDHSSVAMPDGSIILTGGWDGSSNKNDVWRSTNNGATWTQVNTSAGWTARREHSSVTLPDGSIVLTGGCDSGGLKNDTWRSTDNGATWTRMTANAEWSKRSDHSSVAMPDGSIVLTGGWLDSGRYSNDTWRSTNNGTTWTQVNASAGWTARYHPSSVVLPDRSIILLGGEDTGGLKNDTWRSTDNGATWTQINASAEWTARREHSSVVMLDSSILLMGGEDRGGYKNDTWRSTDNGATWTQMTASAGWTIRGWHTSMAVPDGSIVLAGGWDGSTNKNDVWQFMPTESSAQNPSHIYTTPGNYTVALQAYNAGGYNSTRKTGYINVSEPAPVANFTANVTSGTAPLTVLFMDRSTNTPTSWNWSFGDGGTSSEQTPSHTYTSTGRFTVSLNATNAGGSNITTRIRYITVNLPVPVANFTANVTSGIAPLPVSFTDQSSNNPTGWAWFFGDETYNAPWTEMTASAEWNGRIEHTSVTMPDGSIVLMGGCDNSGVYHNDVWRSINNGANWTQQTASAGWAVRATQTSVAMPDGSIVLMGGGNGTVADMNDVWRSMDNGATWTQMKPNNGDGWAPRHYHTSVAMPDGSIVLLGGFSSLGSGSFEWNDVWRSTDNGATWTLVNSGAGWSARAGPTSVVMTDGSIVLLGGTTPNGYKNDVWRSTDNGATWTQMTESAGWLARYNHRSVVMPDDSIVLMGGVNNNLIFNDVWRSTDNGTTWTQLPDPGWTRCGMSSVLMPDGSIVLLGGQSSSSRMNDVWRLMPAGSSVQNPSHTYALPGKYPVALQAYNTGGYNSTRKTGYISVTTPAPIASFTANVTSGTAPLTILFMDNSTNTPTIWNWSFGDGSSVNTTVQHPIHTYASAGTFTVSLNATNAGGSNTTTRTNYITVIVPVPVANFSATPRTGYAPLTVTFIDLSTGTPTSWNWSFGDTRWFNTTTATARNVTHDYSNSGIYTVSLIATTAGGSNMKTEAAYINITAPPSPIGANGTVINQSATVFIGEEGLNLTHALNQAQDKPVMKGEPALKTIGWWAPGSPVDITSPTRILDLNGRYTWFTVEPSDFVGYTGTWYVLRENQTAVHEVFTVADPTLNMKILDYTHIMDVTGKSIPQNTRLGFGITTNMYPAVDARYRNPINPDTDGYIDIKVKNASGSTWQTLYNNSASAGILAGPHSLRANFVNVQPWSWGANDTWSWQTSARDNTSQYAYLPGNYTVSAESTLNHMKDNYRFHGADYTGKTVSPPYTITLRVCGDFNGNNIVDIGDTARVAHMVVGLTPMDMAADFNAAGTVDAGDAAKIAWFLVGKVPAL